MKIADYEKTIVDGNPSYFDDDNNLSPPKVDTISASMPGSPNIDRYPSRSNSGKKYSKRED